MHREHAMGPGETQKAGPYDRSAIRNAVCCSHGRRSSGAWPTRCTAGQGTKDN